MLALRQSHIYFNTEPIEHALSVVILATFGRVPCGYGSSMDTVIQYRADLLSAPIHLHMCTFIALLTHMEAKPIHG